MAQAAPWIGMGLSALGSMQSAKSANRQQPTHPDQLIPSDLKDLRAQLAQLFSSEDLFSGLTDPTSQAARSAQQELISPEYRDSIMSGQAAQGALGAIRDARMPGFRDDITDMFAGMGSQLGAQGHRVSSDREAMMLNAGGRAQRGFEGDIMSLLPQIMGQQIGGVGTFGSVASNLQGQQLAQRLEPLRLASSFATAFPGGGNFNPAGGNSPYGAGLQSAGQAAMMIPILKSFQS